MYTVKLICKKGMRKESWFYRHYEVGQIIEIANYEFQQYITFLKPINYFVWVTEKIKCKYCKQSHNKRIKHIIKEF